MSKRGRQHQQQQTQERIAKHQRIFHSDATKHLFTQLLGEAAMKGAAGDADVERVTKGGVPAKPETLKFKTWLVNNATDTSTRFQKQAFDYAKTSSNAIDNFANQIQAFIKKVQQFLDLMMSYTTDRGIHELHLLVNKFIEMAAHDVHKVVDKLIDQILVSGGSTATSGELSVLSLGSNEELGLSGVWGAISDLMDTLKSILPTVIDDIKFAKREVSAVASTLDSIFGVFKTKGSPIFQSVASMYRTVWIMYYILFVVMTGLILFYAFWAYEWFGGPERKTSKQSMGCFASCCDACLMCLRNTQDGHICFWSCILLSQMVILIMFVVSILFCVLAGIKAFISLGCAQIYVLGDDDVCTSVLIGIRGWMESFWTDMPSDIGDACQVRTLTACKAIGNEMMQSAMFTVGGSFAAATFSFQLLFLSAQLHERAAYNHKVDDIIAEDEAKSD
jgi:hypothetical protein